MSSLKLYGANVCPFVHRVRLTLAEKGLEADYVAIDLRHKPEWYDRVLPSGKVPLLEHDGHRVWESSIVCEYLEDRFPDPNLLPREAGRRAQARLWIDWGSNQLIPPFYGLLKAQAPEDQALYRQRLSEALHKLEEELGQSGAWLLGSDISLADLELYPWFERWVVLEHYRGFPVPADLTHLRRWREAMSARPTVAGMAEKAEFYIDEYSTYAQPVNR